jgi:hypothetical protein
MIRGLTIGLALVAIAGCISGKSGGPNNSSIINDVAVKEPLDSGYRVAAVDGKDPRRAEGGHLRPMVPVVIIPPGVHTLTLEPKEPGELKEVTIIAPIEGGKRYRLKHENDEVTLVNDGR